MKSILDEIKQQPPHIRELFMWVCVVITFSIVGFTWFRSTTKQFVALLNPNEIQQTNQFAKEERVSPFSTFASSLKDLQANLGELFNLAKRQNNFEVEGGKEVNTQESVLPQKLPLSGNKK